LRTDNVFLKDWTHRGLVDGDLADVTVESLLTRSAFKLNRRHNLDPGKSSRWGEQAKESAAWTVSSCDS